MDQGQSDQISHRHEPFVPFAGVFNAEVKIWMGGDQPHVTAGVMTNEFVLDDRYLRQDFHGDMGVGPSGESGQFCGSGFWGYDPQLERYQGFWLDNASSQMQSEIGSVDDSGKVWTMIGEFTNPESGAVIKKRSTITLVDPDHHRMESFITFADGEEHKTMEIEYTRKA